MFFPLSLVFSCLRFFCSLSENTDVLLCMYRTLHVPERPPEPSTTTVTTTMNQPIHSTTRTLVTSTKAQHTHLGGRSASPRTPTSSSLKITLMLSNVPEEQSEGKAYHGSPDPCPKESTYEHTRRQPESGINCKQSESGVRRAAGCAPPRRPPPRPPEFKRAKGKEVCLVTSPRVHIL